DHYFARLLPATAFFLVWLLNYSCFKAKTYFTAFQYVLGRAHTIMGIKADFPVLELPVIKFTLPVSKNRRLGSNESFLGQIIISFIWKNIKKQLLR
ncbi:hypothetical protein, partial [Xanthocytophaga flava]|uniref:hypothetical protein n=1 Tax=Xanthocytophaga flava TaxID=3048013 RepID=UPI0028D7AB33